MRGNKSTPKMSNIWNPIKKKYGMSGILRDKTINDKLMHLCNDDKKKDYWLKNITNRLSYNQRFQPADEKQN